MCAINGLCKKASQFSPGDFNPPLVSETLGSTTCVRGKESRVVEGKEKPPFTCASGFNGVWSFSLRSSELTP